MPLAATALDEIEQWVAVLAVHAIDGVLLPEQGGADFQGGEMQGHQDHALAFQLRLLEVLQPFDMGQARQARLGPPPAHGHLEEGDAGGREVFLEQMFTLFGRLFREAQFQVSCGNAPTFTGYPVHSRPQGTANPQQRPVRQLHNQPQQTESQP